MTEWQALSSNGSFEPVPAPSADGRPLANWYPDADKNLALKIGRLEARNERLMVENVKLRRQLQKVETIVRRLNRVLDGGDVDGS